jgi:GNAT superfamily N-acetyltransferase
MSFEHTSFEAITDYQPEVTPMTEVTPRDVEDFQRLIPQLDATVSVDTPSVERRLQAAVDNPLGVVLVVRDQYGRIQATATGNIWRGQGEDKGWVDDVVADERMRGRKLGYGVMRGLHEWFGLHGISEVLLTSRPDKGPAGKLYTDMGYELSETDQVFTKVLAPNPKGETRMRIRRDDSAILVLGNTAGTGTICRIPVGEKPWIALPDAADPYALDIVRNLELWMAHKGVGYANYIAPSGSEPYPGYAVRPTRLFRATI